MRYSLCMFALLGALMCAREACNGVCAAFAEAKGEASRNGWVKIPAGSYAPFYLSKGAEANVRVEPFLLQEHPVTNGMFLQFVKSSPEWQQNTVPELFAEERYLSHWRSSREFASEEQAEQPVVLVSWFAARAYCESIGARLPTHHEWEYAGRASRTSPDATGDSAFYSQLIDLYSKPNLKTLPAVKSLEPNFYGLYDMHAIVWQWVEDFNSILLTQDARQAGKEGAGFFCGAGALSAAEKEDYLSFLRLGFLSSLKAQYVTKNLGFRCAKDL